jgi:restriction endonuclease Mrr
MPVPTYDRFIEPVLRFLALHPAGVAAKDAHVAAADALGVSAQDRAFPVALGAELGKSPRRASNSSLTILCTSLSSFPPRSSNFESR